MNRRDALRLKRGETILFGDTGRTQTATNWWVGEVLFVTEGGAARVLVLRARDQGWDNLPGRGTNVGKQMWVPYHYIHGKHPRD